MNKYLYLFIFFIFSTNSNANNKDNVINNLKNTKNINFEFEQNINEKVEKGNCIIEYPRKIFCEYEGSNNKILYLILDKNFLINNIYNLKERIIDKSYINYTFKKNNHEINIFFDNKTFNLIGWQTKDIYQNLNITFISSIKKNEIFNKDLFRLPSQN